MGCDGGTIPKRDELVRTKKKKETVSLRKSRIRLSLHNTYMFWLILRLQKTAKTQRNGTTAI